MGREDRYPEAAITGDNFHDAARREMRRPTVSDDGIWYPDDREPDGWRYAPHGVHPGVSRTKAAILVAAVFGAALAIVVAYWARAVVS